MAVVKQWKFTDRLPSGINIRYTLEHRGGRSFHLEADPMDADVSSYSEPKTFEVLKHLIESRGEFVSYEDLLLAVWPERLPPYGLSDYKVVRTQMTKLRGVLKDLGQGGRRDTADSGRLIINVPGLGFKFGGTDLDLPEKDTPSKYHSTYLEDLEQHWKPRAMGSGALFQTGQWYFSGRTAVLRHLVDWLNQSSSGGAARVLTGNPGAGKSATLGFLVTCTDRAVRQEASLVEFLESMPEGTFPKTAVVDFAINLWDRSLDEACELLADRFRCDCSTVLQTLTCSKDKTVLVFDALDEAEEPFQLADKLLRPLAGYDHLWLIVGTRRPELGVLGSAVHVLDLDSPSYQSNADVAKYAERLLVAKYETRPSVYRGKAVEALRAAEAISDAANGNFLIAFLLARVLLESRTVFDPDASELPTTAAKAFEEYLRRLANRAGLSYGKLSQALIPLAYVQGQGMPREVWRRLTGEDVDELLDLASAFILEFKDESHPVFRFYHESLAESLRDSSNDTHYHRTIVDSLIAALP